MWNAIKRFAKDDQGLELVEYAIAGALIVAVGALLMTEIGQRAAAALTSLRDVLPGLGA